MRYPLYGTEEIEKLHELAETCHLNDLTEIYNEWAKDNGYPARKKLPLGAQLRKLGYTSRAVSSDWQSIGSWAKELNLPPSTLRDWVGNWKGRRKKGNSLFVSKAFIVKLAKEHPGKFKSTPYTVRVSIFGEEIAEMIEDAPVEHRRYIVIDKKTGRKFHSMRQCEQTLKMGRRRIRKEDRFEFVFDN